MAHRSVSLGETAERLRRSTVQIRTGGRTGGNGSGVIARADGLIVTNAHVAKVGSAEVETWDGRRFQASLVDRDRQRDLATLRVSATDLPEARFGNSGVLRPGELVIAVGNPMGFTGALSTGVVHSVGPLQGFGREEWVRADVRLAPGNSGGPLANASGEVIGINTMIAGLGRGRSTMALAVPANAVTQFLEGRLERRPLLGVTVEPIRLGRASIGLVVLAISPGSPAEAASLLTNDILVGTSEGQFRQPEDLTAALASSNGGVVRIQFRRGPDASVREVAVRLDPRFVEAA